MLNAQLASLSEIGLRIQSLGRASGCKGSVSVTEGKPVQAVKSGPPDIRGLLIRMCRRSGDRSSRCRLGEAATRLGGTQID